MSEGRVSALTRIDAALARIDAALSHLPDGDAPNLDAEERLQRLKSEVAEVVGELDLLLGRDAGGQP